MDIVGGVEIEQERFDDPAVQVEPEIGKRLPLLRSEGLGGFPQVVTLAHLEPEDFPALEGVIIQPFFLKQPLGEGIGDQAFRLKRIDGVENFYFPPVVLIDIGNETVGHPGFDDVLQLGNPGAAGVKHLVDLGAFQVDRHVERLA